LERDNFASALEIIGRTLGNELPASLERVKSVYLLVAHLGLDNPTKAAAQLDEIEAWENTPVEGYSATLHFLRKGLQLVKSKGPPALVSRLEAILERFD
jgi:hypothetical protein